LEGDVSTRTCETAPSKTGEKFVPFDPLADYDRYVDGKPRYDGVRSFLAARGIELPTAIRTTRRRPETGPRSRKTARTSS